GLVGAVRTYALELGAVAAQPRLERRAAERDRTAIASAVLDALSERLKPHFNDGSHFGVTSYFLGDQADGGALEAAAGFWFCARLNAELRPQLSVPQHAAVSEMLLDSSRRFAVHGLFLHAQIAASEAAHHLDQS